MSTDRVKTLYQIIKNDILLKIENQQFEYDKPICTEKSLSEQYGVSRITSKRAIDDLEQAGILYRKRGVGSFVSRPHSFDAEKEFTAPFALRPQSKTIPVILPFAAHQGGFIHTLEAATRRLTDAGIRFAIHVCESNDEKLRSLLLHLLADDVESLILYPTGKEFHLDILQQFTELGKRVLIIDKPNTIDFLSKIVCDNYSGGYMLTNHLIDYGHRRIAYLAQNAPEDLSSLSARLNGYRQCMVDRGITIDEALIKLNLHSDYHMLMHVVNGLYKSGVTAIECENDEVAFNVYMCCLGLSISVPGQMNITGFDNIKWAVTGSAQLTTIDQNFADIGEAIADFLLSEEPQPISKIIPVSLIPRASTGPVAG